MGAVLKVDGRGRDRTPREAYEVEALGQRTAVDLVAREIEARLPRPPDAACRRERRQREQLEDWLEASPGFIDDDDEEEEEDA
jgi:hypothetical protein